MQPGITFSSRLQSNSAISVPVIDPWRTVAIQLSLWGD
jgi:hypothetical protein